MLRARQKLGKYRITRRIASGPLADVYAASDTIHNTRVALKLPKSAHGATNEDFIREVQLAFKLDHPNILKVQDASFIDDQFVIAMELGVESLADRMVRRIATSSAIELADQALAALAHAHERKIIHCDVKPENFILFPGNCMKLCDFGFAKVSLRTLKASGSGTIDYIAPEQAMGRPKFQSDVFSLGLVLYRLFSGMLPEWPYEWPMAGKDKLQARVRKEFVDILRKALQIDPKKRYRNAIEMYSAFSRMRSHARRQRGGRKRNGNRGNGKSAWRQMQWREFQRQYKKELQTRHSCKRCEGPVASTMQHCPWCGDDNPARGETSRMPATCPRCERGVKTDWVYCAWCYGPGFETETNRFFDDKRYVAQCSNSRCRGPLMPFMRYCPWCRVKVKRQWKLSSSKHKCPNCRWGIAKEFWNYCAWCKEPLGHT
ncbi:MAG: serine/threonine-protein kinase [Woeseiaceae bacterium]|nr:serine/threonine-protein kinase [Woeseiaceae bacterium]